VGSHAGGNPARAGIVVADAAGVRRLGPPVGQHVHVIAGLIRPKPFVIARGFVAHVTCSLAEWMAHSAAILPAHLIETISLPAVRIEIDPPGEGYGWQAYYFRPGEDDYFTMDGWDDRDEMVEALATNPEGL
jgi:hypothetical protein